MAALPDPMGDRAIKTVKIPPHKPISFKEMYPNPGKFSI